MIYGALGERISKNNVGWILEKNSTFEDIRKKLDDIIENNQDYKEKLNNIKLYLKNLRTVDNMIAEYEEIYNKYLKQNNRNSCKIDKDLFLYMLKSSRAIIENENELEKCYNSMGEYHKTVMEYRKEIDRLNQNIENYKQIEAAYNHLISSRKLQFLKKIHFIQF